MVRMDVSPLLLLHADLTFSSFPGFCDCQRFLPGGGSLSPSTSLEIFRSGFRLTMCVFLASALLTPEGGSFKNGHLGGGAQA